MIEERLKIAVFVDFDNIEIGVKTTLNVAFDIGMILDAIKERGEVVTKIAYGDWTRAGDYSRLLTQHAIKMVQRNLTPGGDKNGADINLALDALEMALTHDHINAYVIVGGDSDFLSLVEKLKQYDKTVFVVGGRAFTSVILQRNCHEFIAYENLINVAQPRRQHDRGRPAVPAATATAIGQAFPLVRRALKVLSEREVTPQLGLLKSTLLQLDSTFSEKNYGASSFRDFAEKLAQAGLLRLNRAGRNLLVETKDTEAEEEAEAPAAAAPQPAAEEPRELREPRPRAPQQEAPAPPPAAPSGAPVAAGEALAAQQSEAIAMLKRAVENASTPLRWPMYVRNVKQLMRASEPGFDERRYGFGGILDLLRGGQRDGLLRLERDRQGVLRVFPGPVLQKPAVPGQLAPEGVEAAEPGMPAAESAPLVEAEAVEPSEARPESDARVEAEAAGARAPVEAEAIATAGPGGGAAAEPASGVDALEVQSGEAADVEAEAVEVDVDQPEAEPRRAPARRPRGRKTGGVPAGGRKSGGATKKAKTTGGGRAGSRTRRTRNEE